MGMRVSAPHSLAEPTELVQCTWPLLHKLHRTLVHRGPLSEVMATSDMQGSLQAGGQQAAELQKEERHRPQRI